MILHNLMILEIKKNVSLFFNQTEKYTCVLGATYYIYYYMY
jgi:hypothetical protein